jgi:flagellar L-ring protein FlgH
MTPVRGNGFARRWLARRASNYGARGGRRFLSVALSWLLITATAGSLYASKRNAHADPNSLAKYIARVETGPPSLTTTAGSCWTDAGRLASLSTDYKAAGVGDLITVVVADSLTSSNAGDVSTARTYNTSSGINGLAANPSLTAVANLLGLSSSETLAGKSTADRSHSLTTTLAGRVVAVLGSGNLVIEAERVINMNNEKQTITLRGLVRRGDIGPSNTVASNAIGDLELEIKGKGVISNGVRPPNPILRAIMRIVNF